MREYVKRDVIKLDIGYAAEILFKNKIYTIENLLNIQAEQLLRLKNMDGRAYLKLRDGVSKYCDDNSINTPDWVNKIGISKYNTTYHLYISSGLNDIRNCISYNNALFLMKFGINTIDELMTTEPEVLSSLKGIGNRRLRSILLDICNYRNDGTTLSDYVNRMKENKLIEEKRINDMQVSNRYTERLGLEIKVNLYNDGNNICVDNYIVDIDNSSVMTPREVQVLKLRYIDKKTLEEIGNTFGVTRERIRQIEAKGHRKIANRYRKLIISKTHPELRIKPEDINSEMFILKEGVISY